MKTRSIAWITGGSVAVVMLLFVALAQDAPADPLQQTAQACSSRSPR
jgi:hypothetical protein